MAPAVFQVLQIHRWNRHRRHPIVFRLLSVRDSSTVWPFLIRLWGSMNRVFTLLFALLIVSHPLYAHACCKMCSASKACGDSCISKNSTCHQPPGCACDSGSGLPQPTATPRPAATTKPVTLKPKYNRTSRAIDATMQLQETSNITCAYLLERKGSFWRPGRVLSDGKFLPLSVEIKNVKYLLNFYSQPKKAVYQRVLDKLATQMKKRKKICGAIP